MPMTIAEAHWTDGERIFLASAPEYQCAAFLLCRAYGGPSVHSADLGFYAALWLGAYHPEYLAGLIGQYRAHGPQDGSRTFYGPFWEEFMGRYPIRFGPDGAQE